MLKKLMIVGGLTGVGHLLSVAIVPVAVRYLSPEDVVSVGLIDSTFAIVVSVLAFGLQLTTTRNIATLPNWQEVLSKAQSARLSVGLILAFIGIAGLVSGLLKAEVGLPLLYAPFLALNSDYALYGRGLPIYAAIMSFVRLSFPTVVFIVAVVFLDWKDPVIYALLVGGGVLVSGVLVCRRLDVSYLLKPSVLFIKAYKDVWLVGLAGLCLVIARPGLIVLSDLFLEKSQVVIVMGCMKLFLLFVGVRRLFIQSFYKELIDKSVANKIDLLTFACGFVAFLLLNVFVNEISLFLYARVSVDLVFNLRVLSFIVFISSIFSTSDARLMLMNLDSKYVVSNSISALLFLLSFYCFILLGFSSLASICSLLIFEVSLVVSYKIFLTKALRKEEVVV
ncbi:MAG: O-antigen/teichoic acid export membrane protein [Motiliproteus sp.]|jgi:O-antigen/teichoic acid export membrane protein